MYHCEMITSFKCLGFYLKLGMEADERHGGDFGLPYGLHLGQQPLNQIYRYHIGKNRQSSAASLTTWFSK